MLLGSFYTIKESSKDGQTIRVKVEFNPAHDIFKGHFPDLPVVPGVCMMQMIKEIIEDVLGKATNLVHAAEMKFMAVINPQENNRIQSTIKYTTDENGAIHIIASLYKDELVHFKFKGQFRVSGH